MANLKMDEFLLGNTALNKIEMFQESVLSVPWNVPPVVKAGKKSTRLLKQLHILSQLETFLDDAFTKICNSGAPRDCQEVGLKCTEVQLIKSFLLDQSTNTAELALGIFYHLGMFC